MNMHAVEKALSSDELRELKSYFETNKSGIMNELAEMDQHIALRPLALIFEEPNEELQRSYHSMSFSEEINEDGSKGVYVELVK